MTSLCLEHMGEGNRERIFLRSATSLGLGRLGLQAANQFGQITLLTVSRASSGVTDRQHRCQALKEVSLSSLS